MGQKTNPTGIRLGITTESASKWYAGSDYADKLHADLRVREYIERKLKDAQVSRVDIERPAKTAKVVIHTARPGVIIGQKGQGVETLRQELAKLMDTPVNLNISEVRKPELSAKLVAEQVAKQLEQRVMFRRAMKRAVTNALRAGAQGVKVCVGGRLGGAEIARSEWYREGRVPLHTFRADIDYDTAEAHTTFGVIGVKVWIFKGEKIGKGVSTEKEEAPKEKKKKS
jgi:small subunit ribosomal protein S3